MPFSTASPDAYVALAMQSALGTLNTTPAKYRFAKYAGGNNINPVIDVVDLREGGDGLDFGSTYKVNQTFEGQVVFNVRPEFTQQFLAGALGGATITTAATWNHLFHTNHASHPWNTMQWAYPGTDLIHLLRDVRFLGFTMTARFGQPLQISAPFRAVYSGASSGIALVASYPTGDDFFCHHYNPSIVIDGSADSTVESWTIDFALGVEDLQAQSVQLDDIVVLNRDMNLSFTRRYENSTLWKKIAYGGGVAPTVSVATGSFGARYIYGATQMIQINAGLLTYRGDSLTALDPNGQTVRETVNAKILKTASAGLAIRMEGTRASAPAP